VTDDIVRLLDIGKALLEVLAALEQISFHKLVLARGIEVHRHGLPGGFAKGSERGFCRVRRANELFDPFLAGSLNRGGDTTKGARGMPRGLVSTCAM
jgi:hypothetical protein